MAQYFRIAVLLSFVFAAGILTARPDTPSDPKARMDQLQADFTAAMDALRPHWDGQVLDDDPNAPSSLNSVWTLMGEWTAAYLEAYPAAPAGEIENALRGLDPEISACAVDLGNRAYAVTPAWHEIGTFFIVARQEGNFKVAWSIKDLAKNHFAQADEISAWAAASASWSARQSRKTGNGPLFGCAYPLPPDRAGHSRFYVNASYGGNGSLIGGQLSIWKWSGTEALPLMVKRYTFHIESNGIRREGNLLRIRTREQFKAIISYPRIEPQGEWTICISSDKVEDLGVRFLYPEMSLADELYYRLQRRMATDDIAAPSVAEALLKVIPDVRNSLKAPDDYAPLGGLKDWQLFRNGRRAKLCLDLFNTDSPTFNSRYIFKFVKQRGHWKITEAKDVTDKKFGASCAWGLAAGR